MHVFWSLALIVGALAILVLGLVRVVHDLLLRGPYEAPLIRNDGLAWPARYRGSPSAGLQPEQNETRFAGTTWSERGHSQR
jgi:hypothetical protein